MRSVRTCRALPPLLLSLALTAGCAVFSDDPRVRTPGVIIDDQVIETLVKREIWNSDPAFDSSDLWFASNRGAHGTLVNETPIEGSRTPLNVVVLTMV